MEQLKEYFLQHFEKILFGIILAATFAGTYLVEEEFIVLNFYYLPAIVSSYFLGLGQTD